MPFHVARIPTIKHFEQNFINLLRVGFRNRGICMQGIPLPAVQFLGLGWREQQGQENEVSGRTLWPPRNAI